MRVLKQIDSLTKEQAVKFLTNIGIFETSTDLQNKKGGRYQMLESFREQMSMDTGLDIDKEFVNDPYKASALLINHLVNNFGSETDMMDYYYEHHYGNSGKGLRDRSRDELITNVFTPSQIRSNSYLTENNLRTVGDFIDYWEGPKREQTDKIIRDGKIQYMLKDLGYYFKNIDHNITKNGATEKAMKQFMEEKGLDKEDLEYLSEIYQKIPRESRIAYSRFGTLRDVNPVQASNMGEVASDIYDMMSRNNFDLEKTLPIVEKYGKAFEEGKVTNFLDIRDKVDMGFSYEDAIEASIEKSRVRDATITEGAQILTPIDSSLKEDITEGPIQMFSREGKIDPRIARARKRAQEGGREYREVVRDNTNTRRTQPQEQSKLTEDLGNNGIFDMSNPNIYKALVPLKGAGAAGATMLSKPEEGTKATMYKKGGAIQE